MLKEKYTDGSGDLPPGLTGSTPEMTHVVAHQAANDESLRRLRNHARRMRRHGRAARAQVRRARGWSVGLW
ncbi:MAG: hypothetical protein V2I57_01580 [Xanthomonadales bacterium]|jgi:hypothetical protein|nr:hypothetical protein [Xanthomonadales bacterium]